MLNKNWIVRWPDATRKGLKRGFIHNIGSTGIVCLDWADLELVKSVSPCLELLGIEAVCFGLAGWLGIGEVGFELTGMAWNSGSQFWPECTVLNWRKSVLAWLNWHGMEEVIFLRQTIPVDPILSINPLFSPCLVASGQGKEKGGEVERDRERKRERERLERERVS
jgi:hypothetical protein